VAGHNCGTLSSGSAMGAASSSRPQTATLVDLSSPPLTACLAYHQPHPERNLDECTYRMLGPLGAEQPPVWAEILYADCVRDIAVLGSPNARVMSEKAEEYVHLTGQGGDKWGDVLEGVDAQLERLGRPKMRQPRSVVPMRIGQGTSGPAWVLALDEHWARCTVESEVFGQWLGITEPGIVVIGMSGSPIVDENGKAVGLVSLGGGLGSKNPCLAGALPGWLLRQLKLPKRGTGCKP
jgi:hypothetical protein